MKKSITTCLIIIGVILIGCQNNLTREKAEALIKEEFKYPQPVGFKFSVADEDAVLMAAKTDLEKEGWIAIDNIVTPFGSLKAIRFTEKAKPYLLPRSANDVKLKIHPFKLGEEEFVEVTGIRKGENKESLIVKYTTTLKNITPLKALVPEPLDNRPQENTVVISLYDDGWKIDKPNSKND